MNIYFIFSKGRKKRLINNNSSPSEFFYGFKQLSNLSKNVILLEEEDLGIKPHKSFLSYLFRKLSFFSYGIPLQMIYKFLSKKKFINFSDEDILIATTNGIGLTLAFAQKIGFLKCNLVFIAMGLIPKYSGLLKILIYRFILSNTNLLVISNEEKKYLKTLLPKKDIQYIPFGVDIKFWHSNRNESEEEYIFSIGNDNSRDWETLLNSWDPTLPNLKIVTSIPLKNIKDNVQIIKGDWRNNLLTDKQILSLYNGAKFVIVPLLDTIQPSGQSVCLQAMACNKPVIMSDISGLWDHIKLIHEENILLVEPQNTKSLNRAIIKLLTDDILYKKLSKNGRELVEKLYNIENMSKHLKSYIDQLSNF